MLADVGLKYEREEMQMIRWMCGVSLKHRRTSEELRKLVGVELITTFIRSGRLRFGHVMKKSNVSTGLRNVWSIELKAEDRLDDQKGHG